MEGEAEAFSRLELGRRLKRRRDDLQLRQYEVADRVGMHRSEYSALERGHKSLIHPVHLARLARALQTTTDYLLQLAGEEDRGVIPPRPCSGVQAGATLTLDSPMLTASEAP